MVASKISPQSPDLSRGLPGLLAAFASVFNRLAALAKSASSELGVALPERLCAAPPIPPAIRLLICRGPHLDQRLLLR
jgi:hypothetical protein